MRALLPTSAALLLVLGPSLVSAARPGASASKPSSRPAAQSSNAGRSGASAAASAATTKPRATHRKTVPRAKARAKATKPHKSTEGSAAMAALLRQYVEGADKRKLDRKVAAGMTTRGASRAAGRRILDRIDGASPGLRKKTFGKTSTRDAATKRSLKNTRAVAAVARSSSAMTLRPALTLPPEAVPSPASFSLLKTGIVTLANDDADGSDELMMLAIIARPTGEDFVLETTDLGSETAATKGVSASSTSVYSGPETDALIITVVIEEDNGNGAAAREEIELLVSLAASVAATMPGDDRLAVLKTMVDYTIALDGVGSDPARAARSVVATPCLKSDWFPLWSVDASTTAAAEWKLAIPHAAGAGRYELLLDVPGTVPEMTTVRVSASDLRFDVVAPAGSTLEDVRLDVSIGDRTQWIRVPWLAGERLQPVERKVVAGDVDIRFGGTATFKFPPGSTAHCADKHGPARAACRAGAKRRPIVRRRLSEIDFAPGSSRVFESVFSTVRNSFERTANNKKPSGPSSTAPSTPSAPLRKKTAQGSEAPAGRAVVSVRVR